MKAYQAAIAGAALACLPLTGHALPFSGAEVGAAAWSAGPGGSVTSNGDTFDVEDNFGFGNEVTGFVWAAIEPPLLPNLKLMYTPMSFSGTGQVQGTFLGQPYNEELDVSANLNQADGLIYIQPLDNIVKLGVGVGVKYIEGDFEARGKSSGETSSTSFSAPIPMLHANVGFSLPLTGLSGRVQANGIAYNGNRLIDASASLRYRILPLLNVEAGYRYQELVVDELDDLQVDLKIDGPYLGLLLRI